MNQNMIEIRTHLSFFLYFDTQTQEMSNDWNGTLQSLNSSDAQQIGYAEYFRFGTDVEIDETWHTLCSPQSSSSFISFPETCQLCFFVFFFFVFVLKGRVLVFSTIKVGCFPSCPLNLCWNFWQLALEFLQNQDSSAP